MSEGNPFIKLLGQLGVDTNPAITSLEQLNRAAVKTEASMKTLTAVNAQTAASFSLMGTGAQGAQVWVKDYFAKTEARATQHAGAMAKVLNPNIFLHHAGWMLTGATIFGVLDTMKKGIVDVERGMKGLQTVLPEIAHDQTAYNEATKEALDLMVKYGANLDDTMASARSFGRMYKDVETVMGLTNDAILLNVIDSVALEDAVKGNEAALSVYGKELKSTNEVLAFSGKLMDSLTRLSHESMAQASDLIQILQQASGAAKNAKVEMDQLLGVGASAVRATGLQGQGGNLGRMLRTVFVQLSAPTEKIEETIENIGVKMREASGELRSAYDIILDLALATKDVKISQEELNEAILAASSGKFQYSKLAATLGSFDEIVKNVARSINSEGMTMQMAAQQLDTIERKAKSLHAVLVATFSGAGDTGLRTTLKGMIDVLEQTILGLNGVSSGAINASLGLGALLLGGKMILGVYSRVTPIMAALSGTNAAIAASAGLAAAGEISLATATNMSSAAMSRLATTSALATGGLTLIAGAIALFVYKSGEAEKAQLSLNQAVEDNITVGQQKVQQYQQEQDYLTKMAGYHQTLQSQIESGTMSEEQAAQVKKDLTAVEEGLGIAVGEAALERLKAAGFTEQAVNDEKSAISSKSEAERVAVQNTIRAQNSQTQAVIDGAIQRIQALKEEGAALQGLLAAEKTFFDWGSTAYNREASMYESLAAGAQSIGLSGFAESYRQTAEFSRQRAAAQQDQFNQERQRETDRQMAEQESILTGAEANLMKLRGQGLTMLPQDLISHVPGGLGDSSSGGGAGTFGSELREGVNEAKLALEAYKNAIAMTGLQLETVATRERILDLEIKDNKIPTLQQAIQKYNLLNETIALNIQKQQQLHVAADAEREQLAQLNAQRDELIQQHEEGSLSAKDFNTAMATLSPTINTLEKDVREYGNAWLDAQYAIAQAKNTQNDLLRDYIKSSRELTKETQTKELEAARDKELQQLKDLKEAAKDASEARIQSIQDELDALDEENTLLREQQALEEKRKALADAQAKLANVQAEENTRIFKDGRFQYVANPAELKKAQKDVEDAQEALSDTLQEQAQNAYKRYLQDQIEAERDKQEEQDKSYDDQIKAQEDYWKTRLKDNEKYWTQLLTAEQLQLDSFNAATRDGIQEALRKWEAYYRRVMAIQAETGGMVKTYGDTSQPPSYDTGGPIYADQFAKVHAKEYVLNASTVRAMGGFAGVERLIAAIKMPNLTPTTSSSYSTNQVYNYNNDRSIRGSINVNLPHVTDASGLIRNLKQLAM